MNNETELLQQLITQRDETTLLLLDENSNDLSLDHCNAQLISNRYDIAEKDKRIVFNDFDFSAITTPVNSIIFRIAKEKAINLHIINSALQHLKNGELILIGYKNDGMKSLVNHIKSLGTYNIDTRKHAKQLQEVHIHTSHASTIDTTDYPTLQRLVIEGFVFQSKPGLFGWRKVDMGSRLLIAELEKLALVNKDTEMLDLGCGYGYLSMQAHDLGARKIDATDNSAAALIACKANFDEQGISGSITASNSGDTINKCYDLILCNPPFHQGFDHRKSLSETFIEQASRLSKPDGHAIFVVNEFIGIEKIAIKHFKTHKILAKTAGFKVLWLSK